MAAVVVGDALGAAEVLGQEVELVHGGLEGQLMQSFLRGAGGLWREGRGSVVQQQRQENTTRATT